MQGTTFEIAWTKSIGVTDYFVGRGLHEMVMKISRESTESQLYNKQIRIDRHTCHVL